MSNIGFRGFAINNKLLFFKNTITNVGIFKSTNEMGLFSKSIKEEIFKVVSFPNLTVYLFNIFVKNLGAVFLMIRLTG